MDNTSFEKDTLYDTSIGNNSYTETLSNEFHYFDDINCTNKTVPDYTNYSHYTYRGEIWRVLSYADYIKLVIYSVMIIGGILGNMSVILTVALNKSMRTTINLYVANLAVTDAMICIVCMLPNALEVLTEIYMLGAFMCKFNPFTKMVCLTCSVLTLSAISCDRFMAIVFPLHVRVTKQRTSLVITTVWIISFLVATPFLFFKKYEVIVFSNFMEPQCNDRWPWYWLYDEASRRCFQQKPYQIIYYIVVVITLYFLPIFIMLSAYSLIVWKLWISTTPGEQHQSNTNIQSRARKKVHKMVVVVLIAFILCWTPFQVTLLYAMGHKQGRDGALPMWFREFQWYSYSLAFANSFINPIIYGGYNKSFRDGLCTQLRCRWTGGQFGQSVRSRLTFTTGLKSSSSRKSPNGINNVSLKPTMEMKHLSYQKDNIVSPAVKDKSACNV